MPARQIEKVSFLDPMPVSQLILQFSRKPPYSSVALEYHETWFLVGVCETSLALPPIEQNILCASTADVVI